MKITRTWAMPNKNTFTIAPINSLLRKYMKGKSIDPFANVNKLALITNDINPDYPTDYHMDALDFLKMFPNENIDFTAFDAPFSPRQLSEVYKKLGKSVNMETTQSSFWSNLKKEIGRITKPDGIVLSCGWNSGGIGKKYGFQLIEVLIVPHGGWHNDTIVTIERKSNKLYQPVTELID